MLELIAASKLASTITRIGLDDIGDGVQRLERGGVIGRLVAVRD